MAPSTTCPGRASPSPTGVTRTRAGLAAGLPPPGRGAAEDALPTPPKLRNPRQRLAETVQDSPSEQAVREAVRELNHRIAGWRRFPHGPPIFVPLLDAEEMVSRFQAGQPVTPADRAGHREPWPAKQREAARSRGPGFFVAAGISLAQARISPRAVSANSRRPPASRSSACRANHHSARC